MSNSNNGQTRAVRIVRVDLPGEGAIIRKGGQRLIFEPAPPPSLLAALPALEEDFAPVADVLPVTVDF